MDKQQFDHIENRIRQAADEILVPFSDEAWKRMEIKLDNEFNKDRRRGFIWWWMSLALVGIAVFGVYIYNNNSSDSSEKIPVITTLPSSSKTGQPAAGEKVNLKREGSVNKSSEGLIITDKGKTTAAIANNEISAVNSPISKEAGVGAKPIVKPLVPVSGRYSNTISGRFPKNDRLNSTNASVKHINKKQSTTGAPGKSLIGSRDKESIASRKNSVSNGPTITNVQEPLNDSRSLTVPISDSSNSNTASIPATPPPAITKKDSSANPNEASRKETKVKLDPPASKGLYFLASIAAEATGIKNIPLEYTKPIYGLGVGYRLNKKLSVQTGFYFGKKVYYAGPDDYKVKAGSYIAKFISAEAECYIYDIPLTLRYDAISKQASNVYVTTGLSSYILKRETYDMHFLNPMGVYRHIPYTYKKNVAYLSVLNLSVGYEHKFSKSVMIQVEPYIKIPVSGLGEGDAKLYSTGLQLGIKYQPLKKRK